MCRCKAMPLLGADGFRPLRGDPAAARSSAAAAAALTALPGFLLASLLLLADAVWLRAFPPYGGESLHHAARSWAGCSSVVSSGGAAAVVPWVALASIAAGAAVVMWHATADLPAERASRQR